MRNASLATLLIAYNTTSNESPGQFQFVPVIDGAGGLIPDLPSTLLSEGNFAKIPSMTGTNLDDGPLSFPPMHIPLADSQLPCTHVYTRTGTNFTPQAVSTNAQIIAFLTAAILPFQFEFGPVPAPFSAALSEILALYPEGDPALGSPFGTGNDTFGLSPEYKRLAAIVGDADFQGLRRAWAAAASGRGVPVFAFEFADEAAVPAGEPQLGVTHGTDVPYFYGAPFDADPQGATGALSAMMMDYVIAFVTGLDPNDGKGVSREYTSLAFPDMIGADGGAQVRNGLRMVDQRRPLCSLQVRTLPLSRTTIVTSRSPT